MFTGERKQKNIHRADNAFIGLIGTEKITLAKQNREADKAIKIIL